MGACFISYDNGTKFIRAELVDKIEIERVSENFYYIKYISFEFDDQDVLAQDFFNSESEARDRVSEVLESLRDPV